MHIITFLGVYKNELILTNHSHMYCGENIKFSLCKLNERSMSSNGLIDDSVQMTSFGMEFLTEEEAKCCLTASWSA